jgi:hypothetical protein
MTMKMVVVVQARRTARCAARQAMHSQQTLQQAMLNQTRKENLLLVLTL